LASGTVFGVFGHENIFYQAKLTNVFLKKDNGQGMNKKGTLE